MVFEVPVIQDQATFPDIPPSTRVAIVIPSVRWSPMVRAIIGSMIGVANEEVAVLIADNSENPEKRDFLQSIRKINPYVLAVSHARNIGAYKNMMFLYEWSRHIEFLGQIGDDDLVSTSYFQDAYDLMRVNPGISCAEVGTTLVDMGDHRLINVSQPSMRGETLFERIRNWNGVTARVTMYNLSRRITLDPAMRFMQASPLPGMTMTESLWELSRLAFGEFISTPGQGFLVHYPAYGSIHGNRANRYYELLCRDVGLAYPAVFFMFLSTAIQSAVFLMGNQSPLTDYQQRRACGQHVFRHLFRVGFLPSIASGFHDHELARELGRASERNPKVYTKVLEGLQKYCTPPFSEKPVLDQELLEWFISVIRLFETDAGIDGTRLSDRFSKFVNELAWDHAHLIPYETSDECVPSRRIVAEIGAERLSADQDKPNIYQIGIDTVVKALDRAIEDKEYSRENRTLAKVKDTTYTHLGNLLLLSDVTQPLRERVTSAKNVLFLGLPDPEWVKFLENLERRPWVGVLAPPGQTNIAFTWTPDWQANGWLTQGLKPPREQFDYIVCQAYLEFASDIQAELQAMRSLLEANGELLLSLPNAGCLRRLHALINQQAAAADPRMRLFTRADIEDLMAQAGYRVDRWYGQRDAAMPELDPAQHEVATGRLTIHRVAADDYAYLRAERFLVVAVPDTRRTVLEQDPAEMYALWRATHVPAARERAWIDTALASIAEKAVFHFAIVLWDEAQLPALYRSLASLGEQIWEHWRVSLFAPFPCPENLMPFAPVVSWYGIENEEAVLEQINRILADEPADWVGQIEAGDRLAPHALFALSWHAHCHPDLQAMYSDEDLWPAAGEPCQPYLKPDFDIDYLRAAPYAMGGVWIVRRALFTRLGGYAHVALGVESYDLQLRTWEAVGDKAIGHVADILYHRDPEGGHALEEVAPLREAQRSCLESHLARCNLTATVSAGTLPGTWRVDYALPDPLPLVSILIPNKNSLALITRCIERLLERTDYPHYEIVVIDNGSDEEKVFDYYRGLEGRLGERFRWVKYDHPFNYAAMINLGAAAARGAYHLHLNNDVVVTQPDWLMNLLRLVQRPDVGVVGARLLFPDGRLQHAGLVLGLAGLPAEHAYIGLSPDHPGHFGQLQLVRACSAVTGACLMMRGEVFDAVQGMDAGLARNFNDVDLCLRVREAGWRVLWTPYATLIHEVSSSRRRESIETQAADLREATYFMFDRWQERLAHDPCYNRNLSLRREQAYFLELTPELTLSPDWRPVPRVLAHPADRAGCGEYRIIAPMRALNRAGRVQGLETGTYLSPSELWRMQPDSIVLQRQVTEEQIGLIDRYAKVYPAPRIFEIDDLITNVPIKSPVRSQLVEQTDLYKRFRRAVRRCDRLVVSTDYLAETYRTLGPQVVVVPNHLEGARWLDLPQPKRREGKPRVGWAGASQHHGDLAVISELVKATADKVDWVFLGMCLEEVRPWVKEFHPGVPLDDYPAKLASLDLDLAVAPLEDVPFNHAKSHLRILEYGVLGYPVLCTDLTPYRGDYPVTRVPNRFKAWHDTLLELVADRDALRRAGEALRDHILERWILEDHLDRWLDAWLIRGH